MRNIPSINMNIPLSSSGPLLILKVDPRLTGMERTQEEQVNKTWFRFHFKIPTLFTQCREYWFPLRFSNIKDFIINWKVEIVASYFSFYGMNLASYLVLLYSTLHFQNEELDNMASRSDWLPNFLLKRLLVHTPQTLERALLLLGLVNKDSKPRQIKHKLHVCPFRIT